MQSVRITVSYIKSCHPVKHHLIFFKAKIASFSIQTSRKRQGRQERKIRKRAMERSENIEIKEV